MEQHQQQLISGYGQDAPAKLDGLVEQWGTRETLRDQVRFEESQNLRAGKSARARGYTGQTDALPARPDHLAEADWSRSAGPVPRIQTDEEQCLSLINHADAWLSFLAHDQQAQQWVIEDYATPRTLIGLANYNFDAELASGIEQLAKEFVEEGRHIPGDQCLRRQAHTGNQRTSSATKPIRNSAIFQRPEQAKRRKPTKRYCAWPPPTTKKPGKHSNSSSFPPSAVAMRPRWKTIAYATISVSIHSLTNENSPGFC